MAGVVETKELLRDSLKPRLRLKEIGFEENEWSYLGDNFKEYKKEFRGGVTMCITYNTVCLGVRTTELDEKPIHVTDTQLFELINILDNQC